VLTPDQVHCHDRKPPARAIEGVYGMIRRPATAEKLADTSIVCDQSMRIFIETGGSPPRNI